MNMDPCPTCGLPWKPNPQTVCEVDAQGRGRKTHTAHAATLEGARALVPPLTPGFIRESWSTAEDLFAPDGNVYRYRFQAVDVEVK